MKLLAVVMVVILTGTTSEGQHLRRDQYGNEEFVGIDGKVLEYRFVDSNGNLRRGDRIAKKVFEYDTLGFLVREAYLKENGRPYQYSDGVSSVRYIWSSLRDHLLVEHFDSLGNRTVDKTTGASIIGYKYDSLRKVREISYHAIDGTRINNKENYSRIEFVDSVPQVEKHYDENDKLTLVLNDTIKSLRALRLQESSIARWMRVAKRDNLVDGISSKSFTYTLTFYDQSFSGYACLSVKLMDGDIAEIKFKEGDVKNDLIRKLVRSLSHGHFISQRNDFRMNPIEGNIWVYFVN